MLYHAEPPGLTGERLVPLSALAVTAVAAFVRLFEAGAILPLG